ncbi:MULTISPECIES: 3-hydroxyacyl-CoA dehydrogenase [unclassified Bacillus (in: firmicutes)]|uniref:3-hydroxyacyl-CoA dehydrogenase n=1 Tax=unclassified Bacillus (in: firmicutes) TaxID=185979 RepID=UPI0008E7036B|nr:MULTISPECIES: 3-hydroxyacyl-CoA dehydrogenase [unclassified Bacillus (in: firmicutes)]SFA88418.1 3-hydroxyacyl-CoA dehydrogenase [Bacillus sp. UNCCL13]SFQ84603.1 3-hydroxyacyl-CoA dehydrogenase [Bacillus sp. cl95]
MKNILVIGSGVMGRGIAYVSAAGGFHTTLVDIQETQLENARTTIQASFEKAVAKGKISPKRHSESMNRLTYSTHLQSAASEADLIIEAVPEVLSIKKGIFETIDHYASDHCVFATNTSTMSPTEIGSFTKRPDRVIAMHFFNPVPKMKLVEIIRGLETSEETTLLVQKAATQMGKETVIINEFPGFVTSRISALVGNEAFYMLQEGVASAKDIDKAIKLGLNYPMGPFELGDLVGLDTRLNNLKYLHEKLGEKYRPAPLLEQYVKAGRLGRKTGRGVYEYGMEVE